MNPSASSNPRDPLGIGVAHLEPTDRGPPQRLAVRVAERRDQAAHVGPGRALDHKPSPLALPPPLLEAIHVHLALGQLHRLPGPRKRVGPPASDLDRRERRRTLAHEARGKREIAGRDDAGHRDLALGVPRVRHRAEPRGRLIAFGQGHQKALHPGGATDQDQQQPGGEWIERAGMADLDSRAPQRAAHLRATTSCEVTPAGLSYRTTPSITSTASPTAAAATLPRAGTRRAHPTASRL